MTNDLIQNATSRTDELCNYIISGSDAVAGFIGMSYSEFWMFITISVLAIINLFSLYIHFNLKKYLLFRIIFYILSIIVAFIDLIAINTFFLI